MSDSGRCIGNCRHGRTRDACVECICDRVAKERDAYAVEALTALAGAGIPTPEKGYVKDGGPGQMAADIRRLAAERDSVTNRLKAVASWAYHLIDTAELAGKHYSKLPFPQDRELGGMLMNDYSNLQAELEKSGLPKTKHGQMG